MRFPSQQSAIASGSMASLRPQEESLPYSMTSASHQSVIASGSMTSLLLQVEFLLPQSESLSGSMAFPRISMVSALFPATSYGTTSWYRQTLNRCVMLVTKPSANRGLKIRRSTFKPKTFCIFIYRLHGRQISGSNPPDFQAAIRYVQKRRLVPGTSRGRQK